MERRHLQALPLGLLALGLVAGGCRRAETAATDSGRTDTPVAADSAAAAPAGGALTPDTALGASGDAPPAGAAPAPAGPASGRPQAGRPAPSGGGTTAKPAPASPAPAPAPAPVPAPPAGSAAQEDTVRGIVAEVGSVPVTSIVVKPAGGRQVTLLGSLAREIGQAAGAEVWVSGHRMTEGLHAMRYAVRSVDGQPAVDGTLAADGDDLVLVTADGRRRIARPPQALRGKIGARVWLVGSLDGAITSYGVLRDAP